MIFVFDGKGEIDGDGEIDGKVPVRAEEQEIAMMVEMENGGAGLGSQISTYSIATGGE